MHGDGEGRRLQATPSLCIRFSTFKNNNNIPSFFRFNIIDHVATAFSFFCAMDKIDLATVKFAQALPYHILPLSRELAALHATRTVREHSSHFQYFCSRCGTHPSLRTKVARSRNLRSAQSFGPSHAVTSTCPACGHESQASFQKGDISAFPSVRKRRQAPKTSHSHTTETQPSLTSTISGQYPLPPMPPSSESLQTDRRKQKKKTGLAEMLQRNREKEKARAAAKPTTGLSAFLSTL